MSENQIDDWAQLFDNNKNLKKLQLSHDGKELSNNVFSQLAKIIDGVECKNILQLIENNKQLKRFHIVLRSSVARKSILNLLREHISHKWYINENKTDITLEKIHVLIN